MKSQIRRHPLHGTVVSHKVKHIAHIHMHTYIELLRPFCLLLSFQLVNQREPPRYGRANKQLPQAHYNEVI